MNGFILASTEGQAGKTITTLALLTAFFRNDVHVDVFKMDRILLIRFCTML